MATTPRSTEELDMAHGLLHLVGRGTSQEYEWPDGVLQVDYSRVVVPTTALRRFQAERYGNLNATALLSAPIIGAGLFIASHGGPARHGDFPGIVRANDSLGDVVELDWHPSGAMLFRPRRHEFPLPPTAARSFRLLCDTLVTQYPSILRHPGQPEDMIMRPPSLDVWKLHDVGNGYELLWNPVADFTLLVGFSTTSEASGIARRVLGDQRVRFDQHAWLDTAYTIWRGLTTPTATAAKKFLGASGATKCRNEAIARAARWHDNDDAIATALNAWKWKEIMTIPGSSAAQRRLLHRLKGDRLSHWDRAHQRIGCPHCDLESHDGGQMHHVFWHCPTAQAL